jgi:protein-disulfide isomerase
MRRIVILALVVAPAVQAGARTRVVTDEANTVTRAEAEGPPARGPELAPVTVELFCTYVAPQCGTYDNVLEQLAERHPERLRVVYRQLPIEYRDAPLLAEAAYEAQAQGRFFELQDELYALRGAVSRKELTKAAKRAGLELKKLEAALADGRHKAKVAQDKKWAKDQFGISAAPAVVWNAKHMNGAVDLDTFEDLYDAAYADAKQRIADGTPLRKLYPAVIKDAAEERARSTRRSSRASGEGTPDIDLHAERTHVSTEGAPALGSADAGVTVVFFGDFECPFCRRMQKIVQQLDQLYPGQVRIVFKHFPLPFHSNARTAAEVAACAAEQGKFWEVHEAIYRQSRVLKRDLLVKLAGEAGLDTVKLERDLDSKGCAEAVDRDIREGEELGVEATPTLFINGLKVVGQQSLDDLRYVVDEELRPGVLERITED